jgi:3-hydroxyacyl-CoA dehydrogenase
MRCVVLGAGALPLVAALVRSGCDVSVRAEDAHDLTRLQDILSRLERCVPVHLDRRPTDLIIEAGYLPSDEPLDRVVLTSADMPGLPGMLLLPFDNLTELRVPLAANPAPVNTLISHLKSETIHSQSPNGFVFARVMTRWLEAADRLLLDGAPPWDIDDALTDAGLRIGPYELDDLIGVSALPAGIPRARAIAEGRLGKALGWGWYRYPGGGGKVVDPLIEDLVTEEARFLDHAQRDVSPEEIVSTLTKSLHDALEAEVAQDHIAQNAANTLARVVFGL